jgi:hypothetical protein
MAPNSRTSKETSLMKRKDLANEIRGAGFGLRYADGPATMTSRVGNRLVSHHSPKSKLRMPDAMIIGLAASCSTCEVVASVEDIELATEWADCYQSFARLIWPCIPHKKRCPAKPYIPVSKSAVRYFQKAKAEFDAKRKARAEARAKMTPRSRRLIGKPGSQRKPSSRKSNTPRH